ncbi:hypothetical protein L1987_72106 [Smallanthus sonchifolius]|uniref:Uncharacterized protein n=1 Tax=Smallanthus sonchifolius TaxID=185202 RepID=A0ACB9AUX9_9ASTR|nr:hypothetical protein L1987_72106 [Smallanthus sonchifolius]
MEKTLPFLVHLGWSRHPISADCRNTSYAVWVNEEMNSWSPLFADPNRTSEDEDMSKSGDEDSSASSKKDPQVTPESFTDRNKTGKFSDSRWKPNGFSKVEHGSQSRVAKCNHDALGTTSRKDDISEVAREKFSSGDQVPRVAEHESINEGD